MSFGINRQQSAPISVRRSNRNHQLTVLSSLPPGKCVPLAAIPVLREDSASGAVRIALEMHETVEILMNPVHVTVSAYLVPWLALDRFEGSMDQFNRSYMGQRKTDDVGAVVVPFIETHAMGTHGSNAVYKALGLHGKPTDMVNTAYLEAYNAIWNFRAKNRSKEIEPRDRLATTLAPAFWPRSRFEHIVPDFDQAVIDGEIALNTVDGRLPVKGFGLQSPVGPDLTNASFVQETGETGNQMYPFARQQYMTGTGANGQSAFIVETDGAGRPLVFAEMEAAGIAVSLSNIELAKKTQAFAKLRERYNGHDDEYIIDMLMNGLSIPDQALKKPILLSQATSRFSQAKRYATDGADLTQSVVSGVAATEMRIRVPKIHTGGIVMIVAEIVPEQLFERQQDPFFHCEDVEELPEYLRDELDPEKVVAVPNGYIDTSHSAPDGTFGYAPLNHQWTAFGPRVGGKFYRPTVNTSVDEERQRIWAVETVDPKLSENFYLVSDIHQKPFVDTDSDPFDAVLVGNIVLNGNTVFGGKLREATDDYDKVLEKAPQERIEKEA